MPSKDNLDSFIKDNKSLVKEYVELRLEIFRLQAVRIASKSAGWLVWILISLFLLFLILLFSGIVLGYWLSSLTHSYVTGFGLTTLIILAIFILLAAFRKSLFLDPITQSIIRRTNEPSEEGDEE